MRSVLSVLCALFLMSLIPLQAQPEESHSSWIVLLSSAEDAKSFSEEVIRLGMQKEAVVAARSLFPSGGGERTLLAGSRLDRYVVVDWTGEGSPVPVIGGMPEVEGIYPNHTYHINAEEPNDSLFGEQWGFLRIGGLEAWDITRGESTVLIGVIDTGIEWEHDDLRDALWINPAEDRNGNGRFEPWSFGESREGVFGDLDGVDQDGNGYPDDVIGFDMVDQNIPNFGDWNGRDGVPFDEQGHGTNVAGVIGAVPNNRIGIAGIAPDCRLVTIRAFDATGDGQDDDIAAAIVYAAAIGVDVLNMSFGDTYRSPLLADAVRFARERGVVMVSSSGNDGVPDPHYPSGFDEVISVGATTDRDLLSFFSAYGSQLSLTAPGEGIVTTNPGNGYKSVNGTSFSAPYVAGVAALLRSIRPDWTSEEIRGVLELSAEDLGPEGWDEDFGAGLLDAEAALSWPGPVLLEIASPRIDEGAAVDTTIAVIGSVIAPFLESWSLQIGSGELPEEWNVLSEGDEGEIRETLGAFSTVGLAEGRHTIRLQLKLTDGRSFERRVRIYHDRTPPVLLDSNIRNVWLYDRRALGVTLRTDDRTRGVLLLRPSGSEEPYRTYELEAERTGLVRTHFRFITKDEMIPGIPYDMYILLINAAGGVTSVADSSNPLLVRLRDESFPVTTMERKPWSAPYGYVLPQSPPIVDPDIPELLMNRFDGFAFGDLVLYQFAGDGFEPFDSAGSWLPRGVGDTDGDGLKEVLGQSSGTAIIYEQETPGGSPFDDVLFSSLDSNRFYPGGMYDFNGDDRDEVIGYTIDSTTREQYYIVLTRDGEGYRQIARLDNPTAPDIGSAVNVLSASDVAISDVNGNGRAEILFSDNDDDFILYEWNGTDGFELLWYEENDGREGDNRNFFAAGDVDNDGRDELLLVYRAPLFRNDEREYEPPVWTIRLMAFDDQGNGREMTREEVAWVRGDTDFRTGGAVGELDGEPGEEIVLSIFPNLYLFRWDTPLERMKPFWWRGGSIINQPIIRDFDKDLTNELGVGDGDRINFYQIDPESGAPLPPAGLDAWALSDSSAFLRWGDVPGAERYRIYRALLDLPGDQIRFDFIAETTGTTFADTGVGTDAGRLDREANYGYIVTAVDDEASDPESPASEVVSIFTHEPARLVSAEPISGRQIVLDFSVDLAEGLYRSGAILVVNNLADSRTEHVSSLLYHGERSLLLTFADDQFDQELILQPTSILRDRFGTPADTAVSLTVKMPAREEEELFAATKAEPADGKAIAVTFNREVDEASGTTSSHYRLDPPGEIISVEIDPTNSRRVLLRLEESYPLGPFGFDYTVTISSEVLSADGIPLNRGAGSVVGFTISAESLDELFVYPHPFSLSRHDHVTFAGLPRASTIRIYTGSGALLRELNVNQGDGGSEWDGRDGRGKPLPTGIYLYSVVIVAADGTESESRLKKIAIVP